MIKIATFDTGRSDITILKSRASGAVLYREGMCNQSEADAKGISLATYVHALFDLIVQAQSKTVLIIGCGGGTLGTMLRMADVYVVMVDSNALSFDISRNYFGMPNDVECHTADGLAFLMSHHKRFDAIVLDAYDAGAIPPHLMSEEFFDFVSLRLTRPGGCFLANVCGGYAGIGAADRFAGAASTAFEYVRILDGELTSEGNSLVIAGAVSMLRMPTLRLVPSVQGSSIVAGLSRLAFRSSRRAG